MDYFAGYFGPGDGEGFFSNFFYAESSYAPTPSPASPAAPGRLLINDPWADRDRDATDFLLEVERLEREGRLPTELDEQEERRYPLPPTLRGETPLVEVVASRLHVEVRVSLMRVRVVERGNTVLLIAAFGGDPDQVFASFLQPGSGRPYVDPGYGHPESRIEQVAPGTYIFSIDTTGFAGGTLEWHFWGEGEHQASEFGEIEIPIRKPQLL